MGVEALGSGVASVASAVGRGGASFGRIFGEMPSVGAASVSGPSFLAPTFEAAPIGGLLNSIGPKLEGPLTRIVNEGSLSRAEVENTMPLQIGKLNPVKEIRFNEPLLAPKVMTETVVAEAKHWLGIAEPKLPSWEMIVPIAVPNGLEYPRPQVVVSPAWEVQPGSQSKTESRISSQTAQVVLSAPATKEQAVEKLVKEKVKAEEPKEVLGEEAIMEKRLYLEDQEASVVRRFEIRRAIKLAFTIVGNLVNVVTGAMVARFLPAEHEGNRSQVVKKTGPDGSYQETVEAIASVGELASENQAVSRFNAVVAEKKPVKLGKDGPPVAKQDVARVFKYRISKPALVYEIVIDRVKRQRMQVVPGWETETKAEKSLEELDPTLTEVFQKTA